jgi:hypothetical protein
MFRVDRLNIFLNFLTRDGDIAAAFEADHADIGADAHNSHAIFAAWVFFLHFENVTDVEFFDLHKQLLLSDSEVA